jgi:acetyl-CoA carboxylase biotin carboxyl carrier protein
VTSKPSQRWLPTVRAVIDEVLRSDVTAFELRQPDFRLRLRRKSSAGVAGIQGRPETVGPNAATPGSQAIQIPAPFTGVFYLASSPTTDPYVREGDWVDAGATIGLIETMKIFSEVKTEHAGRIQKVLARSGQLVQAGDPLVILAPSEQTQAAASGF